jgi:hypothetical protein
MALAAKVPGPATSIEHGVELAEGENFDVLVEPVAVGSWIDDEQSPQFEIGKRHLHRFRHPRRVTPFDLDTEGARPPLHQDVELGPGVASSARAWVEHFAESADAASVGHAKRTGGRVARRSPMLRGRSHGSKCAHAFRTSADGRSHDDAFIECGATSPDSARVSRRVLSAGVRCD